MTYVEKSLGKGEDVVMIAKFPWPYRAAAWSALILLGIVGVGIVIWGLMMIHFRTTETALTTRRLVYKRGLFTRSTMELGLFSIEEIELHQSFWGRVFRYGVLDIQGTGLGKVRTHPMAHPVRFRRLILDARAAARNVKEAPAEGRPALQAIA
jgi:uncharacterized membrane protein YdbT with pleckstrin-like domain